MKQSKFWDNQILRILKKEEGGFLIAEQCGGHGVSNATFFKRRSNYGGMDASVIARMKELEE